MATKPKMLHDGLLTPRSREDRFALAEQIERGEVTAATAPAPAVASEAAPAPEEKAPPAKAKPRAKSKPAEVAPEPAPTPRAENPHPPIDFEYIRGMFPKKGFTKQMSLKVPGEIYDEIRVLSQLTGTSMTEMFLNGVVAEAAKLRKRIEQK